MRILARRGMVNVSELSPHNVRVLRRVYKKGTSLITKNGVRPQLRKMGYVPIYTS
jgi:hypothetical protein